MGFECQWAAESSNIRCHSFKPLGVGNLTWPAQDRLPPEGPNLFIPTRIKRWKRPSFHGLKFLDSAAPIGLGHIDIAFGIDRQSVAVGKFTDLVTRPPEACGLLFR